MALIIHPELSLIKERDDGYAAQWHRLMFFVAMPDHWKRVENSK